MKQTIKRFLGLVITAALVFTCSLNLVFAASDTTEVSSDLKDYLVSSVSDILGQLNDLTDENIEQIKQSDNAYFVSVATAWESSKSETGNFVEVTDSSVEVKDGSYVVTCNTKFEKKTAEVVVDFGPESESYAPGTMAINVEYSLGYKMQQAALNTLIGVCIVFVMLLLLSFLISLFKYINKIGSGKKKDTAPAAAPAVKATPAPAQNSLKDKNLVDDLELVAVITAAVAASENTSSDSFVVRSIRRANRR